MVIQLLTNKYKEEVSQLLEKYHIKNELFKEGHITLICLNNDKLVGVCNLYKLENITFLYAINENQAEIFMTLLAAVEKIGLKRIFLNVSKSSIGFFKQFGYKKISDNRMMKLLDRKYKFNSYQEVLSFIQTLKSRVYSLDHFKAFMRDHFNIQYTLKCVHVGGTNGKGSTINYTKEVLKEAGYNVGTFTSPPLKTRLEIVKINDVIMEEKVACLICERFMEEFIKYELSTFEIEVFLSVLYFIYKGVDIVLYEVGLGGLLDATNIMGPMLSVNTNIGLDHIDYLGDSYTSIAKNKAGIIKYGVPFMTGERKEECLNVFDEVAYNNDTYVILIDEAKDINIIDNNIHYNYHNNHITLNTNAYYQVKNSTLAICILEFISSYFPYSHENLLDGLFKASWAGRFEKIHDHPLVIIDGAHNKEGMEAFYESVKDYHNPHIIFSALKDKDTNSMIETLLKITDDLVITEFVHERATTCEDLAKNYPVKLNKNYKNAIDEALETREIIFITGSLYFLSLARDYILKKDQNIDEKLV